MTKRPVLFVLAGVNGAGKSSVGGYAVSRSGGCWFNPDTFARELMAVVPYTQPEANALAWQEGMRRLDHAVAHGLSYAFETTLGGRTVPAKIASATRTHDVLIWYCGLSSPEKHIERVSARVAAGGHDIPEAKIKERYVASTANLIALMPLIARLQVYDNSADADGEGTVPDPWLLADIVGGRLVSPRDADALRRMPDWAKPVIEVALA